MIASLRSFRPFKRGFFQKGYCFSSLLQAVLGNIGTNMSLYTITSADVDRCK